MKYSDYFEHWVETYRTAGRSRVTVEKYQLTAKQVKKHPIGQKELKKITRADIQGFLNWYGETHARLTTLDFNGHIKASFGDALVDGYIKVNPYQRIELNSKEKHMSVREQKIMREQKKWLEFKEYNKLKKYLIGEMHRLFQEEPSTHKTWLDKVWPQQMIIMVIYVALKTGMRFAEIIGLTESDIDYDSKKVNVDKTWDYKFCTGFAPTKNFASIREIAVDQEFIHVIWFYLDWCKQFGVEFDQGAIFIKKNIKIYNVTANTFLTRTFLDLDIEPISLHKLRHTQASILIAKGISLQVVAKRLGHTDTNMIQQVYGHLLKSVEEKETEKLLRLI